MSFLTLNQKLVSFTFCRLDLQCIFMVNIFFLSDHVICVSYCMVCASGREDNPRALARMISSSEDRCSWKSHAGTIL